MIRHYERAHGYRTKAMVEIVAENAELRRVFGGAATARSADDDGAKFRRLKTKVAAGRGRQQDGVSDGEATPRGFGAINPIELGIKAAKPCQHEPSALSAIPLDMLIVVKDHVSGSLVPW